MEHKAIFLAVNAGADALDRTGKMESYIKGSDDESELSNNQ